MNTTVILGSGLIGVATAYYLSEHQIPSTIHLVDPSPELFSSASGFAGGFLAKDWFAPQSASLGLLSFSEHQKLAEQNDGRAKWGYTKSSTFSHSHVPVTLAGKRGDDWLRTGQSRAQVVTAVESDDGTGNGRPPWLRQVEGDDVHLISEEGTTGLVDPLRLCQFLLQTCLDRGVRLHHPAKVISVRTDARHGEIGSVRVAETTSSTETDLPCTHLLIAAGAWSPRVFAELFPRASVRLPISSLAGHSLVFRPPQVPRGDPEPVSYSVYSTTEDGWSPELYARLDGNIYIAGINSATEPLPPLPSDAVIDAAKIRKLKETAGRMVSSFDQEGNGADLEVVREGHCFRPVSDAGVPILARIPDADLGIGVRTRPGPEGGVYVAAGHGPWGITLGLGTGKVMAEMMQGRRLSADVSGLGLPYR
ncbi:FAD dependent oxidoreductase superfamily [Sodiomyces alkalinus F11]|uniref:FAD dependent oxidoreductase superfamily n=1 Tax=Sodiomyces alkalinus (strain CBS 110278 / VKM F-3762 / F11) TaxID=1314773 RepID=A0A3N2Q2K7_SODAK|nr:FAD dependent oxidoreductase superfamily [Sodiomyces alkalinus F11]ROT41001.1 FAD dependent oxidoreductase superfamily [Sodiomyces alkalinus F11]